MKATIFQNLNQEKATKAIPKPYVQFISNIAALGHKEFNLACFPHAENGSVVLSSYVRKLIDSEGFQSGTIVVGQNFTIEASKLMEERGIKYFGLKDYFWTDESYMAIRRGK